MVKQKHSYLNYALVLLKITNKHKGYFTVEKRSVNHAQCCFGRDQDSLYAKHTT